MDTKVTKGPRVRIWLMLPKNICVECHVLQGHKKPETPEELGKK